MSSTLPVIGSTTSTSTSNIKILRMWSQIMHILGTTGTVTACSALEFLLSAKNAI